MIIKRASLLPWNFSFIKKTPNSSGIYILRDGLNSILYIGAATDKSTIQDLVHKHYEKADVPNVKYFDWYLLSKKADVTKLKDKWLDFYSPSCR